jgi:hypothetical protein
MPVGILLGLPHAGSGPDLELTSLEIKPVYAVDKQRSWKIENLMGSKYLTRNELENLLAVTDPNDHPLPSKPDVDLIPMRTDA